MVDTSKMQPLRKDKKMTQEELAMLCEVSKDYISMLERGIATPGIHLAKKIADALDTTIDELFFNNKSNEKFGNQTA